MIRLVMAAYTMAFAAVIVGARFGDEYGHGRVFAIGLIGFAVMSLVCGLARQRRACWLVVGCSKADSGR
jgi:MFS family permease